ncbi:MAG: metallophosphoesterase [bacterium]|nr:metallophosphoesterase [bacterium]
MSNQKAKSSRTLIVGDVHGCVDELAALTELVGYVPGQDRLIQVGDLINRGPDSLGTWKLFKELKGQAVLGNHELHLIRDAQGIEVKKRWLGEFKEYFGSHFVPYLADIKSWPLYIEEDNLMVVHAGLVPGQHPSQSDPRQVTSIRTWDGWGQDLQNEANPPWFDFYQGPKLTVFGHWAKLNGLVRDHVVGLDTGCVYGKELTGLLLPERVLVSVPAARTYCPIKDPDPMGMDGRFL